MDNADRASLQQVHLDKALSKRAMLPEPKMVKNRECIDCDAKISKKRLEANSRAIRCIGCQEAHEAHKRNYR